VRNIVSGYLQTFLKIMDNTNKLEDGLKMSTTSSLYINGNIINPHIKTLMCGIARLLRGKILAENSEGDFIHKCPNLAAFLVNKYLPKELYKEFNTMPTIKEIYKFIKCFFTKSKCRYF